MKSISEIIGGAQGLLNISFDIQYCFEEVLNDRQKTFLSMLRCIEEHLELPPRQYAGTGRKPYQYLPFFRSQLAKNYFQITTTRMLIERLKADPNLRLLCGFEKVPGKASFSRALSYLSGTKVLQEAHDALTEKTFKGKIVYHVCRDSTAIHSREKAEKKTKLKRAQSGLRKRGRPFRTVGKRIKAPKEMELQVSEIPCGHAWVP